MKTKDEILLEGYPEDWACECVFCGSWNCHEYEDLVVCFDCKKRERRSLIKRLRKKTQSRNELSKIRRSVADEFCVEKPF